MLQSVLGYLKYPDVLKEHCAFIFNTGKLLGQPFKMKALYPCKISGD
jgi:hypothetical protein